MGVYKKAIITDAGEALRARAVAGEASMQFSHAKTSTYVYPDGTDLTKLTDLQEIRQTVIPSNVQIANDTLISVRSLFGNEQINEAYLIQNVGVYATDGENEILFAVCQAITPDQMPAYDGVAPSSFIYNVQLTVSQAAQISLVVNTAGTATTQDVLELEQKKVNGNGGDISETVIAATEKSQAEYPVPAAGDSAKTVLGKVQKFFGDLRNWMTGVCLLGQIVNNCVTDNVKLPLSAAQGKVLMDLYNVLNTNQKNTAPKNHASTANTYGLGSASSYGHVKLSDSYTASGGAAANGVCASSKAVNEVYKKFNAENTTNSGQNIQSITSSADNYTDIKSIDISPGVYIAIARIEFQSTSAIGDRKGRLVFSTSSDTVELATECVCAASSNWTRLNVCDIFKTNISGSIKVQGSQSSASAINTAGCVTCVRLKAL